MKIWNYNRITGELKFESIAQQSPLDPPGIFMVPAFATIKSPDDIESKIGFTKIFNQSLDTWELIEDNRNKTFFEKSTKNPIVIDYLGPIKSPELYTDIPPDTFDKWDESTNSWILDDQKKWASIRSTRNSLLAQCDYVILKSLEIGKPIASEWVIYRQALRDITKQSDPANIIWPEKPIS